MSAPCKHHGARAWRYTGTTTARRLIEAQAWLLQALSAAPVPAEHLRVLADEAGIRWGTAIRARIALGARPRKRGFGQGSFWEWHLPPAEHGLKTAAPGSGDGIAPVDDVVATLDQHGQLHIATADGAALVLSAQCTRQLSMFLTLSGAVGRIQRSQEVTR